MFSGKALEDYATLVLKIGVNLQKNQGLEIACPVERQDLARALTKKAYELGAKIVRVRWDDEVIDRLNFENAETDVLTQIPKWLVDSKEELVKQGFCYVAVAADNPQAFKDVPAEKLSAYSRAKSRALKKFSDQVMSNGIRWCVISVPTSEWAKQVFPDSATPERDLLEAIGKTMRLNCDDPLTEWQRHIAALERRAQFMNSANFEYLHFKNSIGTDLKVGLCKDHVWLSAKEKAKDGIEFVANMPTEEIFTAPHRLKIDGTVRSALPLADNGQIIDNFTLQFKKGKVVSFSAEKGYENLKRILETDKGTLSIGEVALIGKNSPIAESGILFYNTLFDENASCHLALGKAYPTTVKNGDKLSSKELKERGANDSIEHVDFMIGTPDLSVVGIKSNGEEVPVFKDGEWII